MKSALLVNMTFVVESVKYHNLLWLNGNPEIYLKKLKKGIDN